MLQSQTSSHSQGLFEVCFIQTEANIFSNFLIFLGRKFNKNGELIAKRSLQPLMRATVLAKNKDDQWSKESITRFQSRTNSLKEQFNKYRITTDEHSDKNVSLLIFQVEFSAKLRICFRISQRLLQPGKKAGLANNKDIVYVTFLNMVLTLDWYLVLPLHTQL